MKYSHSKRTDYGFQEAIARVKEALEVEGFGVLSEIDVKKTMKEKVNADYDDYVILGVCNPPFAHMALATEKEVGLLLPCNVIVYRDSGKTVISAILPDAAMSFVENPELARIAKEVREKLERAIDAA